MEIKDLENWEDGELSAQELKAVSGAVSSDSLSDVSTAKNGELSYFSA